MECKQRSWRVWSASAAFAMCAVLLWVACNRDEPTGSAPSEEVPLHVVRNATTVESDSGRTRYVFRAKITRIFANELKRAEDIQVEFYGGDRVVSVLTAERGRLDPDGKMVAEGHVVVNRLEDGAVLETESLYWDVEQQKIRTDEFFKITENDDVITGSGLTTDPDFKLVEIVDPSGTLPNAKRQ